MKARVHHINLSTEKVEEMDAFYREVLGLEATDEDVPALRNDEGVYAGDVAFVSDGHMHLHIARKDVQAGFRTGQLVNPVMKGHVAYRTDDLAAFKAHLEAEGFTVYHPQKHSFVEQIAAYKAARIVVGVDCSPPTSGSASSRGGTATSTRSSRARSGPSRAPRRTRSTG